jgi:GT2 family glycosyltransferase
MKQPPISVVMPVYNMEAFIMEAVESILNQTFDDFEFIIVDDASGDGTSDKLAGIDDSRIIRLKNSIRQGNYRSRNKGLDICRGKYVCVMDADDIADHVRFEKQYRFMEDNPQLVASGTFFNAFTDDIHSTIPVKRLLSYDAIKVHLLWDNVFLHPGMIIKNEIIRTHGIRYNENYYYAADYNMMVELSRIGEVTNLPEYLMFYRKHKEQISSAGFREQQMYRHQIQLRQIAFFNARPTIDEIIVHHQLLNDLPMSANDLNTAVKWSNKLMLKNRKLKIYDEEQLFLFFEKHLKMAMRNVKDSHGMENTNKKILAIIVTYNGARWITNCLKSLRLSTQKLSILIIDNHSDDHTVSIIKENYPEVILIENERNTGFGQANNIGLQYAITHAYDYVLLLNQDATIAPDMMDCLLNSYEGNQEYGILSPLHFQGNGSLLDTNFYYYITNGCRNYINDLIVGNKPKQVYTAGFINAAIWLLSIDCIKKVGGFDPIFSHTGEDVDYCNRIVYHGFRIGLCPTAIAFHHRENRVEKNFRKKHFFDKYTNAIIRLKNPNINQPRIRLLYSYIIESIGCLFFFDFFSFKENAIILFKLLRFGKRIKKNRKICIESKSSPFLNR